jgi:hypothetical protein
MNIFKPGIIHSTHLSLVCIPAKQTTNNTQYSLVTCLYTAKHTIMISQYSLVTRLYTTKHTIMISQYSLVTRLYTSKTHFQKQNLTKIKWIELFLWILDLLLTGHYLNQWQVTIRSQGELVEMGTSLIVVCITPDKKGTPLIGLSTKSVKDSQE